MTRLRLTPRRLEALITAALALGAVVWLLAVEGRQGIGRDEAQYFRAGERYWGWFEELADNLARRAPGPVVHTLRASIATGATTRPITPSS